MNNTLHHYLDIWNLSNPQILAQTVTSDIYRVQLDEETVILKLISDVGFEERNGATALHCYAGQGAVRLLQADEHAHLLEYADGEDLTEMVKRGDDEAATQIIADVLNQLHRAYTGIQPDGLTPLRVWFRSLFRTAEREMSQGTDSIYVRGAKVAGYLLDDPHEQTVLHGDIHHENIRHKAGRGWLAFDPKGLYGERTYDAANTFCNPLNMRALVEDRNRVLKTADIFSHKLYIERSRILAFTYAYTCLSASWSLENRNEQDARSTLRVAEIIEPLL